MSATINNFTKRYPFAGPISWMVSIQYFVIQVVVAQAWTVNYSLAQNTISDLGNTTCAIYAGRFVCSAKHGLMNASFVILGVTMVVGSILVYQKFKESKRTLVGFSFMAIAGIGTLIIGLFPENSVSSLHAVGAALPFLIGNLGLVILGLSLRIPRSLRYYTLLSGVISLLALVFFVTHNYLGLGQGGLERLVAYPQTIWLIVFGVYSSLNHANNKRK